MSVADIAWVSGVGWGVGEGRWDAEKKTTFSVRCWKHYF